MDVDFRKNSFVARKTETLKKVFFQYEFITPNDIEFFFDIYAFKHDFWKVLTYLQMIALVSYILNVPWVD